MGLTLNLKDAQGAEVSQRLRHTLGIHFDKDVGAPYWLDKQKELGIDVIASVRSLEDLSILGPMDENALATRPVEDFIPRMFGQRRDYILAETAGTLGKPKFAVHRSDEFRLAFVTPFVKAAGRTAFPSDCHWLFVGPTGPHVIGRAARACAAELGSGDVFTVDFDPRWAKKLPSGSFSAQRYLEHIEAQALSVLAVQNIGVLFSTPAVLGSLAGHMDNNVICAIAQSLAAHAVTLRFDYRGVGDSQINLADGLSVFDYWSDLERTRDYTDAVRDVSAAAHALTRAAGGLDIPFCVIGYSFGAATGLLYGHEEDSVFAMIAVAPPLGKVSFEFLSDSSKPSLFIIGTGDFLYSAEKTGQFRRTLTSSARVEILDNVDHFFRGDEDVVARMVDDFICINAICSSRRTSDDI